MKSRDFIKRSPVPAGLAGSLVRGDMNLFRVVLMMLMLAGISTVPLCAAAEKPGRIELAENWKLASATDAPSEGAAISVAGYQDAKWHPIHRMPATVLEILEEDGVYSNLYVGTNMLTVPQDLYKQDWWYRTTFKAPAGEFYTLEFPGINYRAEIWLNGEKIADSKQVAGMYAAHEFNVTPWMKRGSQNVLAVKVTPEQLIEDVNGVELADSWYDWINWKYMGYKGRHPGAGVSYVPDRNAGVWKPVYLRVTGNVSVNHALVNSDLSLAQSTARLTVFASLRNLSAQPVGGTLKGTISRPGKPAIHVEQSVTNLSAGKDSRNRVHAGTISRIGRDSSGPSGGHIPWATRLFTTLSWNLRKTRRFRTAPIFDSESAASRSIGTTTNNSRISAGAAISTCR